jgi:NAD(P)-dependent dehydrogenase (short-subunit alcohol dehydrogenase family)
MVVNRFAGQIAIVYGAHTCVGLAVALRLAHEGARGLVVSAPSAAGATAAAGVIEERTGANTVSVTTDATTFEGAKAVVDQAVATFGRVDLCFIGDGAGPCSCATLPHNTTSPPWPYPKGHRPREPGQDTQTRAPHRIQSGTEDKRAASKRQLKPPNPQWTTLPWTRL